MADVADPRLLSIVAWRSPISRDRWLLLFTASNLGFLAFDVAIAHSVNGFVPRYEWIPVIGSLPGAATALWLAFHEKPGPAGLLMHIASMLLGVVIGVMGTAFHVAAALSPAGHVAWAWIVFGAPVLAPLSFAGVSLIGLMAVAHEGPEGSGRLSLGGLFAVRAPLSKSQHLLWFTALGFAGAAVTSFLDHGQYGYRPFEWVPVGAGLFATLVIIGRAVARAPGRLDEAAYIWTMLLAAAVGVLGFALHLSKDLADSGAVSLERMRVLAPVFAPLLFTDLAMLGLLVVLPKPSRASQSVSEMIAQEPKDAFT